MKAPEVAELFGLSMILPAVLWFIAGLVTVSPQLLFASAGATLIGFLFYSISVRK